MTSPLLFHSHVQRSTSPFGPRPQRTDVRLPEYRSEFERGVVDRRCIRANDFDCCGSSSPPSPPPSHSQQERDHEYDHEIHFGLDYAQRMNVHTFAGPLSAYPASCTHSHEPKHTNTCERTRVADEHEHGCNTLLLPLLGTIRPLQPRSRLVDLQQHLRAQALAHAHAHHPTPLDLYKDCPICHYHSGQHSPNCPRYKGR